MRIAICDDVQIYREQLEAYCRKFFYEGETTIQCFSSGNELLAEDREFDLLFLDIEMPGMDGIKVKDIFEEKEKKTIIIFLTSYKERVLEAFGRNVQAFLEKPLQWEVFQKSMSKVQAALKAVTFELESKGQIYRIKAEEIRYIEAQDKYTLVVTPDKSLLVRQTMNEWENMLDKTEFVRANRTYFVHMDLIELKSNEIFLEENKKTKISRRNKDTITEQYKVYLRKRAERV